jgi:hypothetical protein
MSCTNLSRARQPQANGTSATAHRAAVRASSVTRCSGSTPAVGSSRISTGGETRRRCPPWPGRAWSSRCSPVRAAAAPPPWPSGRPAPRRGSDGRLALVGVPPDLVVIVILRHQAVPAYAIGLALGIGAVGGPAGAPLVKFLHRLPPGVLRRRRLRPAPAVPPGPDRDADPRRGHGRRDRLRPVPPRTPPRPLARDQPLNDGGDGTDTAPQGLRTRLTTETERWRLSGAGLSIRAQANFSQAPPHELTKHPAGLNTSVMVVLIGAEGAWA